MNFPLLEVKGFTGAFRFLSNFESDPVFLDDVLYPTVEHAYQAAKSLDPVEREYVRESKSASTAKKRGKTMTVRPNWALIKEDVMYDLLLQKFSSEKYRKLLLETGTAYLEETNYWKDTFWGVCGGVGLNRLGVLLMQVRYELKNLESSTEGR